MFIFHRVERYGGLEGKGSPRQDFIARCDRPLAEGWEYRVFLPSSLGLDHRNGRQDSALGEIFRLLDDQISGQEGDVLTVLFTVAGVPCLGLNGGPSFKHSEAFSSRIATAAGRVPRLRRHPAPMTCQPIVILGGFLISPEAYAPLVARLEELSGQPVRLVAVGKAEWLLTVFAFAWARILDRVLVSASELARQSPTGRVTLIGHSSGGIMMRLFLDGAPFQGRRYDGKALADTLVMLGSPHTALKATVLRQMVAERLPGSPFADRVRYVSVAGDLDLQAASPMARRLAPAAYRNSSGDAEDRGDGLVPVASALLAGSTPVVLPGVAHGGAFGPSWYGSPEVVERWWTAGFSAPGSSPGSSPAGAAR